MKTHIPPHRISHRPSVEVGQPVGGTLTEVLMAIMIMAIGIVSVATMFPLSMIKSIQATQLTSSTVLRYNAESVVDSNKLLVFDPDGDWDRSLPAAQSFMSAMETREHFNSWYVVDPVGYFTIKGEKGEASETGAKPAELFHCWLGNDGTKPINRIRRFPGFNISTLSDFDGNGTAGEDQDGILAGRILTGLPDSWLTLIETDTATISGGDTLTFPATVDLSAVTVGAGNPPARILIFDGLGTKSQTRPMTDSSKIDPGNRTVTLESPLSSWMTTIGTVRVQVQDYRYSWMLLVRRQPLGDASVDVVCFQGRPFASTDEQAYDRALMAAQISDFDTTRPANAVFQQGSDFAYVQFPTSSRPWIQKNGYVLDVQGGHFYRIQGFREVQSGDNTEAQIQLERKASGNGKQAIFMRGIVDVYPIGVKNSADLE